MAANESTADRFLRRTQSLCPSCRRVVPAELLVRGDDVWMRQTCPDHGTRESVYWQDAELFQAMDGVVAEEPFCKTFECLDGTACDRCLVKSDYLFVDYTNRCNLDCPICWADANTDAAPDPNLQQILDRLPAVGTSLRDRLKRSYVVFVGGEPTLRADLPEAIRQVVARGFTPRVSTNGIRLLSDTFRQQLWDAGLRDVLLQFDGFDEDVSQALRGARIAGKKRILIDKLQAQGFNIELTAMIVKGVNDRNLGEWIRMLGGYSNCTLNLYPASPQNRFDLDDARTYMSDVVRAIEEQTEGRITRQDFLDTLRMLTRLKRVLPSTLFTQKLRVLTLPIIFDGDDYFPAIRLLNRPSYAVRYARYVAAITAALPQMAVSTSERSRLVRKLPFLRNLVVAQFHSDQAFDLEEASNCHIGFVTKNSYVPFDLYNVAQKAAVPAWGVAKQVVQPTPQEKAERVREIA